MYKKDPLFCKKRSTSELCHTLAKPELAPLAAQCRDVTIKRSGDQDGAVDQQGRLEVGEGGSAGLDRRVGRDVDQQEGQSGGGRGSADLKKRVDVQQSGMLTSMGFISADSFKKCADVKICLC